MLVVVSGSELFWMTGLGQIGGRLRAKDRAAGLQQAVPILEGGQRCGGRLLVGDESGLILNILLDKNSYFAYYFGHMGASDSTVVLERQLLLQLGDRLKRLRKAQGLGTVEMAKRAGISRTTLSSVETGDPGPAIGTYLRVMSVLGISGELALLAGDALQPGPPGTAAAKSKRARPVVQVTVSTDDTRHQVQDLQSLALHEEAIRLARSEPEFLHHAQSTLDRWLASGNSRSMGLWQEWQEILRGAKWRKVLGRTRRAQELRQASPLTAVLPAQVRQGVLDQIGKLRKGVVLGDLEELAGHQP